jgi:hypothetical protein
MEAGAIVYEAFGNTSAELTGTTGSSGLSATNILDQQITS